MPLRRAVVVIPIHPDGDINPRTGMVSSFLLENIMVQVDFCNPANNETPLAALSFLVHAHLETISGWVEDFEMGAVAAAKKSEAFDVALNHDCDWETYDAMQVDWSFAETILKATSGLKLGDSLIERRLRDDLIALAALVRVMTTFFEVVSADIAAYIHD